MGGLEGIRAELCSHHLPATRKDSLLPLRLGGRGSQGGMGSNSGYLSF